MRALVASVLAAAALASGLSGCTAAYDDDGELLVAGSLEAAAAPAEDAQPVVVDTDLGGDDLVALAFLLRRSDVRVVAVTIAGTGLVGCADGVDLVADLVHALGEGWVEVACGREDAARPMPAAWREHAARGPGLPRRDTTFVARSMPAPQLISSLAQSVEGLRVVALGPLTNLADLAERWPDSYDQLAGITTMAGALDDSAEEGVAEWNAAADPEAFAAVLAARVPLTVVPDDAIPVGTPAELEAPVVGAIAAATQVPKWWDLATAAAAVAPGLVAGERGTWAVDTAGRLVRTGPGRVLVARSLDETALAAAYAEAF